MPNTMENGVFIILMGSAVSPIAMAMLLKTPASASSIFQAYTRRRNEVQNGNITSISNAGRLSAGLRARKYANG